MEAVAFFTPRPRPYFPCLLSCLVSSHLLRDSLCTALQTEKLWIWSTGLSTQLTPSSWREAWVRGNLTALTERSQLATRWTRGRGGEEFRKREQLSKASQGCPSWLKQWEERSALRLRLLTAIWILSWRSSRLCKGKLMVLETRMDKESSRGIGMRLLAPRLNNRNLIFFGSPEPALASAKGAAGKSTLGRALQWDALAFLPYSTDTC